MAAIAPRTWDETDIPAVCPQDLAAALSLWLARERQGLVLVGSIPPATIDTIETHVIEMHDDPARGLSVLLRLRGLIAALSSRRFHHLVRGERSVELMALIAAASVMRLNPTWGMSPVRLAWTVAPAASRASSKAA